MDELVLTSEKAEEWNSSIRHLRRGWYMKATVAHHLLGDVSRAEPEQCWIWGETDKEWVGNWVDGPGFINVKFPKETTSPSSFRARRWPTPPRKENYA
jgi:hypothetical protein